MLLHVFQMQSVCPLCIAIFNGAGAHWIAFQGSKHGGVIHRLSLFELTPVILDLLLVFMDFLTHHKLPLALRDEALLLLKLVFLAELVNLDRLARCVEDLSLQLPQNSLAFFLAPYLLFLIKSHFCLLLDDG